MASKSEQVFIYLRTIGAAAAAREVNKLAAALRRLKDAEASSTDSTKDNADAVADSTGARKEHTRTIGDEREATEKLTDTQRNQLRHRERMMKINERISRASAYTIKDQVKLHRILAAETAKAESARRLEFLKTQRAAERAARQEVTQMRMVTREQNRQAAYRGKLIRKLNPLMNMPQFRRPMRVAAIGGLIMLVADSLSFLMTGVNALGAGAIALVGQLAPMMGMLVAIPGVIGAGIQAVSALTVGFQGMGAALGGDKEAMEDLEPSARRVATVMRDMIPRFENIQDHVQGTLFRDFAPVMKALGKTYIPILNTELTRTAKVLNSSAKGAGAWLNGKGEGTIASIMKSNVTVIGNMTNGLGGFGGALLNIVDAAGPMLRRMSRGFEGLGKSLLNITGKRKADISDFFLRSYDKFKEFTGMVGDLGKGLGAIVRGAKPLGDHMWKAMGDGLERFSKWATSPEGAKAIGDFFTDMKPNLDAIAGLAGDFAGGGIL